MRQQGFTLIELVMIIILVGILAVYASSRSTPDFTSVVAAEELREAIRHSQQYAMDNTGVTPLPGIQIDGDGFVFLNINSPATQWNLIKPNPVYNVTISPTGTIRFNARGEPTTCTGSVNCSNITTFTISANGESSNFNLEPFTGLTHQ